MSQKLRKKTAKFVLSPDGFSIHTFELWMQLTKKRYTEIRDFLYGLNHSDVVTYKNDWNHVVCKAYKNFGIGITLEKSHGTDNQFTTLGIRIFISPRRLLDPDTPYLGILEPSANSIALVDGKFHKLFKETPISSRIDKYIATRVDLCTNIQCDSGKLFREMVRVIHKLPTPPKYHRKFRKTVKPGMSKEKRSKAMKADNAYNKHYFKVSCKSCDLVIYDKGYQITAEGLESIGYEKLPNSVLRFECRYNRDILCKTAKDMELNSSTELLEFLIENSESLLISSFSRYFDNQPFCRFEEIKRQIINSKYRRSTQEVMLEFSERLRRGQIVDKVLERMEKDGWKFKRKELFDQFHKLGVNPIPLWNNFCAPQLPSPVALLQQVSGGPVSVNYIVVK